MLAKTSRIALCTAGAVLLSGCQFINGLHLTGGSRQQPQAALAANEFYTLRGRELLRNSQPGAAIEAFNLALATGEAPAPAYNGLGIAYVRLGRPELAYRFFKKANMSDPANPTYAANLDRLMKSPEFSLDMTRDYVPPSARQQSSAPALAVQTQAETPSPAPGRLHRDGPRQFSLVTLPASSAGQPSSSQASSQPDCKIKRKAARQASCAAPTLGTMIVRRPAQSKPQVSDAGGSASADATPVTSPTGKRKVVDLRAIPAAETPGAVQLVAPPFAAS